MMISIGINKCLVVGSELEVDMKTAKNANIEAVGCSWGFRSFETLFAEHPAVIIDEPMYISKLF